MATLVLQLQRQLVPYTVMLVVPLLRRMSDAVPAVRRKAALCFGSLTALLPLAHGLPLPEGLDDGQRADAQRDGEFLSQLLDNRRVEDYSLPMQLKVRSVVGSTAVLGWSAPAGSAGSTSRIMCCPASAGDMLVSC
jgi:TATA-binding protein-associated factor